MPLLVATGCAMKSRIAIVLMHARAVGPGPRNKHSSASPPNLSTSPPKRSISAIIPVKRPFSSVVSSSAPSRPSRGQPLRQPREARQVGRDERALEVLVADAGRPLEEQPRNIGAELFRDLARVRDGFGGRYGVHSANVLLQCERSGVHGTRGAVQHVACQQLMGIAEIAAFDAPRGSSAAWCCRLLHGHRYG